TAALFLGELFLEVFQIYMTIRKEFHIADGDVFVAAVVLYGMKHGVVFDLRRNDVSATQVSNGGEYGCVVTFRTSAGEEDLAGVCVQKLRHSFSRVFNGQPAFPPIRVDG